MSLVLVERIVDRRLRQRYRLRRPSLLLLRCQALLGPLPGREAAAVAVAVAWWHVGVGIVMIVAVAVDGHTMDMPRLLMVLVPTDPAPDYSCSRAWVRGGFG